MESMDPMDPLDHLPEGYHSRAWSDAPTFHPFTISPVWLHMLLVAWQMQQPLTQQRLMVGATKCSKSQLRWKAVVEFEPAFLQDFPLR